MNGIAVNIILFFLKGIPEGFLTVLALFLFTNTKISGKKYLLLGLLFTITTYLIRLLPIALGVNTVLSLFILLIAFFAFYKPQLSGMMRTIISAVCIFILIAVCELMNMLLLTMVYGQGKAESLFDSKDGLTQSLYSTPSTIFFAAFIAIGFLLLRKIGKRK